MSERVVLGVTKLGSPWQTLDPFLFCVHHLDRYPAGQATMGPDPALLKGRRLGMDFEGRDGWSMYHGEVVPGFPGHPHRGFETVTVARQGFIDHSDSLGATARFGRGDVQWMTAGAGVVHSEMFPLLNQDKPNPMELFQIWLNLPSAGKREPAHFAMMWAEQVPVVTHRDEAGRATQVTLIAGELEGQRAIKPPPASWAAREQSQVAIWSVVMAPGARWVAPPAQEGVNRVFYVFGGGSARIGGEAVASGHAAQVSAQASVEVVSGASAGCELLILQGRPIGEPVAARGPFVMNTPGELQQAMMDYQRTRFGGWPWPSESPVHPRERGRFAIHADGREELPPQPR